MLMSILVFQKPLPEVRDSMTQTTPRQHLVHMVFEVACVGVYIGKFFASVCPNYYQALLCWDALTIAAYLVLSVYNN